MKIKFVGAAGRVTGSCHWLIHEKTGIQFLVDCGMTQQGAFQEVVNPPFPFDASRIAFVLLTHAHIDHCGRIPELFENGFKGKIYCTKPTGELTINNLLDTQFIKLQSELPFRISKQLYREVTSVKVKEHSKNDSGGANENGEDESAKENPQNGSANANEKNEIRQKKQIKDKEAAEFAAKKLSNALKKLQYELKNAFEYRDEHQKFSWNKLSPIDDDILINFLRSSHLLGAVGVTIAWEAFDAISGEIKDKSICFSGDVGSSVDMRKEEGEINPHPLLKDTQTPHKKMDFIVMESTYGKDKRESKHKDFEKRIEALHEIIVKHDSHTVIFPAFAMGRTQDILFDIVYMATKGRLSNKKYKIYLDSPLAQRATDIYLQALIQTQHGIAYRYRSDEFTRRFFMTNDEAKESRQLKGEGKKSDNKYHKQADEFLKDMRENLFPQKPDAEMDEKKSNATVCSINDNVEIHFVSSKEIPEKPNEDEKQIIITASGMLAGGPVMQHLSRLDDKGTAFVISGYQTQEIGLYLKRVANLGEEIPPEDKRYRISKWLINAEKNLDIKTEEIKGRIFDIGPYYSGHADCDGLLRFLFESSIQSGKSKEIIDETKKVTVFLNHGTTEKRCALRDEILKRVYEKRDADFRRVSKVEMPYMDNPFFNLDTEKWETPNGFEGIAMELAMIKRDLIKARKHPEAKSKNKANQKREKQQPKKKDKQKETAIKQGEKQ